MALVSSRANESSDVFDPNPGFIERMPARPYRVLAADLPFYSDPECKSEVAGARLVLLKSEDPKQKHQIQECMPTRMNYKAGQLVRWDLNNKNMWQGCWYRNPDSNKIEKAWTQAVEFIGRLVKI
jgi:hypothetical protein